MNLPEAKAQFIQSWGVLGSQWGINRTMAQIHALLLVSAKPLSTEEIMEQLSVSRGNTNMNVRELIDWDLVHKVITPGERKEFFEAEKDIWKVATLIMYQRKKRELDPMVKTLNQLSNIEGEENDADVKAFTETVGNIKKFAGQAEKTLDTIIKAEENWFWGSFLKLFR
ncbi:GbsR/MarR family transcriptional regulator [Aridibaculum aurantiacum]|uniref:GbsR/MarR family transcriptional regulator n=1 Tax=Aridibaculum aurantiacum TaxID=2810307 RepID=UPI001A964FCE|nr:MarR family transcriptional regulator [Aridibaculum aurantiacum]